MIRLFLLYAILIFAKRAPKLISDLLKLKGDGIGLKGLNIKNKMGEAALVGDKVKKGMLATEGKTKGAAGGFLSGFKNTKGGLKERLKGGAKGAITGSKSAGKEAVAKGDAKGLFKKGYDNVTPMARKGAPTMWDRVKAKADDISGNINAKGYSNVEISNLKDFEKLKKRLVDMYGNKKANSILANLGPINFGNQTDYEAKKKAIKEYTTGFNGLNYDSRTRTTSQNGAYSDLLELGTSPNGQLFIRQNILDERKKLFEKLSGFDDQIANTMQSIDPTIRQAVNQRNAANAELSAIVNSQQQVENNLLTARNALAHATTPEMRAMAQAKVDEYLTLKTSLHNEKLSIERTIAGCDMQINGDQSYQQAMQIIDALRAKKTELFDTAVAQKLLEKNAGLIDPSTGNTIDIGVSEVSHSTEADLYASMGEAVAKNNKALSEVSAAIEDLGKDPTPPSKSDK